MSLGMILLIILILMLVGALPNWGHSKSWGYGPSGGLGLVLVILAGRCGQSIGPRRRQQPRLAGRAHAVERVVEVTFGQLQNGRFRHSARLLHWRPDRDPSSCTFAQIEVVPAFELGQIFFT